MDGAAVVTEARLAVGRVVTFYVAEAGQPLRGEVRHRARAGRGRYRYGLSFASETEPAALAAHARMFARLVGAQAGGPSSALLANAQPPAAPVIPFPTERSQPARRSARSVA